MNSSFLLVLAMAFLALVYHLKNRTFLRQKSLISTVAQKSLKFFSANFLSYGVNVIKLFSFVTDNGAQ